MSHVFRVHPRIRATVDGPAVKHASLHLQQSDLDGACGTHCALMALMVLGIVERGQIEELPKPKQKPLAKFWRRSSRYYFAGSSSSELKAMMQTYQKKVSCSVAIKRAIRETLRTLKMNGVSIIGIHNRLFKHWVLAIGVAGSDTAGSEYQLLVLDPSLPVIPLMAWNATLSVKPRRSGAHFYETALGTTMVLVDSALALTPAIAALEYDID